ncbi:MAG: hypothetical protein EZS28_025917 [Streblomastix strix]|uniref:Uncharacterized protein n=1 Tax=Streblomastix strix TaxID=222440 RepID=A0A5J4V7C9_9EUKA|nr:MAG: hypothetical protein EZS28_025917 [Streblomastix strix]
MRIMLTESQGEQMVHLTARCRELEKQIKETERNREHENKMKLNQVVDKERNMTLADYKAENNGLAMRIAELLKEAEESDSRMQEMEEQIHPDIWDKSILELLSSLMDLLDQLATMLSPMVMLILTNPKIFLIGSKMSKKYFLISEVRDMLNQLDIQYDSKSAKPVLEQMLLQTIKAQGYNEPKDGVTKIRQFIHNTVASDSNIIIADDNDENNEEKQ